MDNMDQITKAALLNYSSRFPRHAIAFNRQFLDKGPCGFVPNDWDGKSHVYVSDEKEIK